MHPLLNIAIRAARVAGDFIVRSIERADTLEITDKGRNDFVTEVDKEAERRIIDVIHKAYPSHGVLAEESGTHSGDDHQWVIDPLDGTTNFLHGFPHFSVSIAVQREGTLYQGVVFDPLRQELFTASRGGGARLDDRRIRVSKRGRLDGALIGTGFPFREMAKADSYLATLRAMMTETAGVRRAGSAALDLAYVACGRLDGFWELGLQPWDLAAGMLLIREAGGMTTDAQGGDRSMETGDVVAANPRMLRHMLRIITPRAPASPAATADPGSS